MEKCKTVEAKLELLKTLFEKLTLILLALGGGFIFLTIYLWKSFNEEPKANK